MADPKNLFLVQGDDEVKIDGWRKRVHDRAAEDQDATIEVLTSTGELEWKVPLPEGFGLVVRDEKLAWAPDGASIAFTGFTERIESGRQPTGLWIADVAAQAVRQVPDAAGTFAYGPAWASDGTLYLVSFDWNAVT